MLTPSRNLSSISKSSYSGSSNLCGPPQPQAMRTIYLSSSKPATACRAWKHIHKPDNWPQKPLIGALAGALSFALLISSPSSVALDSAAILLQKDSSSVEYCQEDDDVEPEADSSPGVVSNEGIVEEAWEIVNDSFLDTRNRWSPDKWLDKKEEILSSSIQTRTRAHDIIKRMLTSLGDPYTRYLSPEQFSKMAKYDMTGIGINIRELPSKDGSLKLKVLGLILDGPAHSAGVRQGDEILSINGEDVKGRSAFAVSSMLQGPNETFVTIEVKHGSCGPIQSIKVQRQVAARTPVFYRLEHTNNGAISVGYMRLKEFNALARKDLVTAMKRLEDSGASYFVLDLRDNFGGLVQAGTEIAKLFLNTGDTIAYTVGREPESLKAITTEAKPLVTAPLLVLVNHNTASASEIVASALHDNCRAVLVGERTYGKGLIQSVFELHDGSGVVVTIGKYVTPSHLDINGNGLEPDFRSIPNWDEVAKQLSKCNKPRNG